MFCPVVPKASKSAGLWELPGPLVAWLLGCAPGGGAPKSENALLSKPKPSAGCGSTHNQSKPSCKTGMDMQVSLAKVAKNLGAGMEGPLNAAEKNPRMLRRITITATASRGGVKCHLSFIGSLSVLVLVLSSLAFK